MIGVSFNRGGSMAKNVLVVAVCIASLVACANGTSPSYNSPLLTAVANGHTVTRQEFPEIPFANFDTVQGFVAMTGSTDPNKGPFENIGLLLWHFTGVGTYPLHLNQTSGGSAYYGVTTPTAITYEAHGGPDDVARVEHYDLASGTIDGTFAFTGVDPYTGDTVRVTEGRFVGIVHRTGS